MSSTKRKKVQQNDQSQSAKLQKGVRGSEPATLSPLVPIEGGVQVLLPSDERLLFVGSGTLKVLSGEVEVGGNIRGARHNALNITVHQAIAISVVSTEATIPLLGHGGAAFSILYNNTSATESKRQPSFQAMVESECTDPEWVSAHPPFPPSWVQLATDIAQSVGQGLRSGAPPAVIVVCGAKKVGKSSLTRLLANVLLNHHRCVAYLDSDCGQPEFTPPGLVSLSYINAPIIGSPSSHQRQPEASYFIGDISPGADPQRYIGCVQKLFADYMHGSVNPYDADVPPLVVNTHGWIKGQGFMVLVELLRSLAVTHFVNVTCDNDRRNLPDGQFWGFDQTQSASSLMYKIQALKVGLKMGGTSPSPSNSHSHSHSHPSAVEQRADLWRSFAAKCVSTTEQMVNGAVDVGDALATTPPYVTSLSGLKIDVLYSSVPEAEVPYVLNATVAGLCVDLCDENEDKSLRKCLGIALIRGVDVPGDKLYVLTPLDDDSLERVNVLEIGRLELPSDLLQTSQYLSPYLTLHSLSAIASGSAPQRARNNLVRAGQVK